MPPPTSALPIKLEASDEETQKTCSLADLIAPCISQAISDICTSLDSPARQKPDILPFLLKHEFYSKKLTRH